MAVKIMICIAACLVGGFISSLSMGDSIGMWYAYLKKPPLNPPSWVFAPVWTVLYTMMGTAAALVWHKGARDKLARTALYVFWAQMLLNFLWSFAFFGMRSPVLGLAVIALLWSAIVLTIALFYRVSKSAAYLLMPYIFWVSFAFYLNAAIMHINR
ncbi:MAG: TspO/MBR family protein [Candidatus Omnitrophota bacterium]